MSFDTFLIVASAVFTVICGIGHWVGEKTKYSNCTYKNQKAWGGDLNVL